jgi:hypothetical protein
MKLGILVDHDKVQLLDMHWCRCHFYAPAIKWLGHIVLPYSVLPSFLHHQFLFIILVTAAHIQCKFKIWICHEKIQVKFEFGHRPMIFDRVMPLDEIFSYCSLSPQQLYTFNSNLTYGYVKGLHRSRWFDDFGKVMPLSIRK